MPQFSNIGTFTKLEGNIFFSTILALFFRLL